MRLMELSREYRESGNMCRARIIELHNMIQTKSLTDGERLLLQRRLAVLTAMARDAFEISNHLAYYYERNDQDGQ